MLANNYESNNNNNNSKNGTTAYGWLSVQLGSASENKTGYI